MTNALPNPGFEVDASNWLRESTATAGLTRDTTQAHSGAASGLWTPTVATYITSGTTSVPALPGQTWSARAWVRGAGTVALGVMFLDAASATIGATSTGPDVATSAGAWSEIVRAGIVAPAGTAYVRLRLFTRSAATLNVDDLDLGKVPRLTATVLEDLAAVRLEVADVPNGPVPITRLDRNGDRLVRQLPGQEASAGLLAVVDYEPALAGAVRYELDAGQETVSVEVDLGGVDRPVVTVPTTPQVRAALAGDSDLIDYDETRTSGSVRHGILGASLPVVILRPMTARVGALTFRLESYDTARAVADVLSAGRIVLVRQALFAGLDLYASVESVRVAPIHDDLEVLPWTVVADYAEAPAPAGGLAGAAAWTVQDVVDLGATVAGIPALFPRVYDLTVGPR